MLTQKRWGKELQLMRDVFPQFGPFAAPPKFGFQGRLRGKRTGRLYEVVLEADERVYPQEPVAIYMNPRIGHHWIADGRMCVEGQQWIPARDNFGSWLLRTIEYLEINHG